MLETHIHETILRKLKQVSNNKEKMAFLQKCPALIVPLNLAREVLAVIELYP